MLVPDGAGVRNFILGSFLREVGDRGRVMALTAIPDHLRDRVAGDVSPSVTWHPLLPYADTAVAHFLRRALSHAHLCWGDTESMRYARRLPINGSWRTKALTRAARAAGRLCATPHRIQALSNWHVRTSSRLPSVADYRRMFAQSRPSVVFCTHQRPLEAIPLAIAARSLGIPTATFIFSWDNLTSKGRIAAPFDHYLVWSRLMREELLRFYPHVPKDHVHVVGTPQFDPYANSSLLWTREEFCRRWRLDGNRPIICYSGGEANTTPEDPQHVRELMELIRAGRIVGNPQVVLRPAPVASRDEWIRYEPVCARYPEIVYARPQWIQSKPGDWTAVLPQKEDVAFLANLTHHVDLNINLASTMTLDFAIHDKPVVNIAFDVASPPPFRVPVWEYYYRFEHYRPVVELGAARFARSPAELAEHVNTYLRDPGLDRDARKRFVELEVGVPIGSSTQHVADVLMQLAV